MASAIRLLVHANVPAASLGPIVVSPARGTTVVSYVLPMVRAQVLGSVRAPQASRAMHASTHARGMLMVSFVAARVRVRIRWPGPSVYARHLTSARAAPRLRMATSWSPRVAPVWRVSALVVQRHLALGMMAPNVLLSIAPLAVGVASAPQVFRRKGKCLSSGRCHCHAGYLGHDCSIKCAKPQNPAAISSRSLSHAILTACSDQVRTTRAVLGRAVAVDVPGMSHCLTDRPSREETIFYQCCYLLCSGQYSRGSSRCGWGWRNKKHNCCQRAILNERKQPAKC